MDAIITGVLGVLIGGFIGHRLALGRDKRIEHNSIMLPLKQKVLEHIDSLKNHKNYLYISEGDISKLRCRLSEKQYSLIKVAHNDYAKLYQQCGTVNEVGYEIYSLSEYNKIEKSATELNNYLRLK